MHLEVKLTSGSKKAGDVTGTELALQPAYLVHYCLTCSALPCPALPSPALPCSALTGPSSCPLPSLPSLPSGMELLRRKIEQATDKVKAAKQKEEAAKKVTAVRSSCIAMLWVQIACTA